MRIHIVTPVTTGGVRPLDDVAHLTHDGLRITHSLPETGPPSIESEYDEAFAVPAASETHPTERRHGIPVIDPIPATACIAEATARAGLTHGKHRFPEPRPKTMAGYAMP